MSGLADDIREKAIQIAPLLSIRDGIRASFQGTDLLTTTAAMRVLIGKGLDTPESIHSHLRSRECPYDLPTIQFLANAYAGGDSRHCLWFRGHDGRLHLLN